MTRFLQELEDTVPGIDSVGKYLRRDLQRYYSLKYEDLKITSKAISIKASSLTESTRVDILSVLDVYSRTYPEYDFGVK